MDLKIRNKRALITGASRGIGRAIALSLAKEGVSITGVARTPDDLEKLVSELPSLDPDQEHNFYAVDFMEQEASTKLLSFLEKDGINPDILVHNVGGNLNITDPFCSLAEWQSVMRVNVEIPIEMNRILIPAMREKKWGRVCHISSISGVENQGPPSYCAAKAALIAYTRSVGRYVAKDNVVLTTLLPGPIYVEDGYWDVTSKTRPDHVKKFLEERVAIQRFGKPEEIGELAAFLCSELSSFCVGSPFLVDGGQGRSFFHHVV